MMTIEQGVFWTSAAALFYTYIGYPIVIYLLGCLRRREPAIESFTPTVSVVVACHNEESHVESRVRNLLESDYPIDKLELVLVSDGSTDSTVELMNRMACDRVRIVECRERVGKAGALNAGVDQAAGEIVVFADARQRFEQGAIKRLAARFGDSRVGAVSGELLLPTETGSAFGDGVGLYWRYEKWIRESESRFDSTIGATGAIYAVRRRLWSPLPPSTILDDVYTPMRLALEGYRVLFEKGACALDESPTSDSREFHRKVRTLAGNYQLCRLMPRLLLPVHRLVFQFLSHKILRLAAPFFLLALLISSIAAAASPSTVVDSRSIYSLALIAQGLFYAIVAAGAALRRFDLELRFLNVAYAFSMMNAAALVALFYFAVGKRDIWVRGK